MPRYAKRRSGGSGVARMAKRQYLARVGRTTGRAAGTKLTEKKFFTTGGVRRSSAAGELKHKHILNILSSEPTYGMGIQTSSTGQCQWSTSAGNIGTSLSFIFSLNQVRILVDGGVAVQIPVPGIAALLAMYDSYRIDQIDMEMYVGSMNCQDASLSGSQAQFQPIILMSPDTEDAANTPLNDLLQYSTTVVVQPTNGKPATMSIKPAAIVGYNADPGGAVAGFGRKFSPTLAIATPDVGHFGIKMCSDMARTTNGSLRHYGNVTFRFRYHVTMMGTR